MGNFLHDIAGGHQRGRVERAERRPGPGISLSHAADWVRVVCRVRGAHGNRHAQYADRGHVGYVPAGRRQRGERMVIRSHQGVRQLHVAGRSAAAFQPVADHRPHQIGRVPAQVQAELLQSGRRCRRAPGPVRVPDADGRAYEALLHAQSTGGLTVPESAIARCFFHDRLSRTRRHGTRLRPKLVLSFSRCYCRCFCFYLFIFLIRNIQLSVNVSGYSFFKN